MINFRRLIEKIHEVQINNIKNIDISKKTTIYSSDLKRHQSGLYWIYSDCNDKDFIKGIPSSKKGAIKFNHLVNIHSQFLNICNIHINGFRIVYNGIAGTEKEKDYGLRERILAEFRASEDTGSLGIKDSSLKDTTNWKVSFVLWEDVVNMLDEEDGKTFTYKDYSQDIERTWRIHYGWPILCRR